MYLQHCPWTEHRDDSALHKSRNNSYRVDARYCETTERSKARSTDYNNGIMHERQTRRDNGQSDRVREREREREIGKVYELRRAMSFEERRLRTLLKCCLLIHCLRQGLSTHVRLAVHARTCTWINVLTALSVDRTPRR